MENLPIVYVAQPHDNSNYAQVFATFDAAIAYVTARVNRPPDSQTDGTFAQWHYWNTVTNSYSGETSWIVLQRRVGWAAL